MPASAFLVLALLSAPQDGQAGAEPSGEAAAEGSAADEGEGATEAPKEPCQVAVMTLQPKGLPDDQKHVPELLTDSLAAEVATSADCKVITQADIIQMLDFEATKAACSEESESCLAEIGGALGVDRVIGGTVGMLGSSFKLQVKLQNVREGRVEKRIDRLIKGEPELLDVAARNAGRELFGLEPLPEGGEESASSGSADKQGQSGAEGGEAGEGAPGAEGGSALGTVVLTLGLVGVGAGLLAAVAAGGLAGFAEAALNFPQIPFPADQKPLLQPIGWAGLAGLGIGVVLLVVGGGLATVGLFVE